MKLEIVQLWRCASCKRTFTPGPAAIRNKTYPLRTLTVSLGVTTASAQPVVSGTDPGEASSAVVFAAASRASKFKQSGKVARSSSRYAQRRPARAHEAQENNLPPNLGFGLGR